jgi:hypothetical protein
MWIGDDSGLAKATEDQQQVFDSQKYSTLKFRSFVIVIMPFLASVHFCMTKC